MHLLAILEIMAQVFFIHHAIQRNKSRYWIAFLLIPWIGFLVYFFTEWISAQDQANPPMGNLDASSAPVSVKGRQMAYISQGKLLLIKSAMLCDRRIGRGPKLSQYGLSNYL